MSENYFSRLNGINVNGRTEKKNGLAYLSWAWAWSEVKENFPDATYTIYENADGWFYHTDGKTCWVKTGVTVNGIEHIEYLPVMNYNNKSIPADKVTSFDVNTAIQRSLTKACARHGLGLYLYAGEDLPEGEDKPDPDKKREKQPPKKEYEPGFCADCGLPIFGVVGKDSKMISAQEVEAMTRKAYGRPLCAECKKHATKQGAHG